MTARAPILTKIWVAGVLLIGANLAAAFALVVAPGLGREFGFRADRPTLSGALVGPFLHANLFHLLGNLVFLAAVGAAVEIATGPLRFGLVYFASMLAGVGLHWIALRHQEGPPLIGASGAVAGCAAYYGVRYRSLRVAVGPNLAVPVLGIVGFWAVVQLVGAFVHLGDDAGGSAYWAHLGGLGMGAGLALSFRAPDLGQARIGHEVLDRMNARGPAAAEAAARAHLRRHPDDPKALRDLADALHDLGEPEGEGDVLLTLLRREPVAERPALLARLVGIGQAVRLPSARRVAFAEGHAGGPPDAGPRAAPQRRRRGGRRPPAPRSPPRPRGTGARPRTGAGRRDPEGAHRALSPPPLLRSREEARLARLKDHWRERRPELISGLVARLVLLIGRTLRVETRGFEPEPERIAYCGWHGRTFPFAVHFRNRGWWVIVSLSRDGDIQNAVFERLGYQTARGSTGRGGARAAVRTIKGLRDGGVLAMTPDGPRGPAERVQEGVLLIARRSGARLVPVGVAVSDAWILARSWDRYVIPKPFSRALIVAGEAIAIAADASPEETEAIRLRLEERIVAIQASVSEELRGEGSPVSQASKGP